MLAKDEVSDHVPIDDYYYYWSARRLEQGSVVLVLYHDKSVLGSART